jgi:nucleoside-diphosphate-sugar epimerase
MYGDFQYAHCKIFNEWQAKDYADQYGMTITGIRPANVTGFDKIFGSIDHVNCITLPARGKPVRLPFADAMRVPIHVDDIAEAFARVTLADKPRQRIYNSGGVTLSLGEIAAIVREFLPDADIGFDKPARAMATNENYLVDNSRLVEEFGLQIPPFRERVRQIINDVRQADGKPPIAG